MNFDGATKGNLGPSGAGAIVRDYLGNTIAIGAKKLEDGTNNLVEAKVALLAVGMAQSAGVKKIHLEGDSLIITQAITNMATKA